jgi:hypothetical protein
MRLKKNCMVDAATTGSTAATLSPLTLVHLPLCACAPRLQQLLASSISGDAYHRPNATEKLDAGSKGTPVVMQYLHVSDALQPSDNIPPLLVCPPECYLQQLCVSERIRVLPLFQICLSVASELRQSLRVVIVALHRFTRWRSVLPVFQLVPADAVEAAPVPLPTRTAVHGPHVDVVVGRRGDVVFQCLSAMVDTLLTLFTVLTLIGWCDPDHHVCAAYRTTPEGTMLLLSQVKREPACSGARLSVWDEEQDLTVLHRIGHHLELVIVILNQVVVHVQCGDCGAVFTLFRPHVCCPRCTADITCCLRRGQSVLLRLSATTKDLR